jgi:hypothetical protein
MLATQASTSVASDSPIPLTELPPEQMPAWLRPSFEPLHTLPVPIAKKPGHFSVLDWKAEIDSYWGTGLPGATKTGLVVQWWNLVQTYSTAFHNSDTTIWDSVWAQMNPAVIDYDTVSRGWYAALMYHSGLSQRDIHVEARDDQVTFTYPSPGVPVMYVGGSGDNRHFGAALTPLEDSTLLVYDAINPHPLGLVPGDLVLGYDGVPWKDLYPQLLAANLPVGNLGGTLWGGNERSVTHNQLMAAGNNWHLFDSVDVVKYNTGDTLRLATSPLAFQPVPLWGSEQIPIPSIPRPMFGGEPIEWGVLPGTSIGYIYHLWVPDGGARTRFRNALVDLVDSQQVTALIVDFRLNYGGLFVGFANMDRLFGDTLQPVNWFTRCGGCCRLDMCEFSGVDFFFTQRGTTDDWFKGPIAILTGPNAVSLGDQMPHTLSLHPSAKVFGKPTGGHFNGYSGGRPTIIQDEWFFGVGNISTAQGLDNSKFMIHSEFPSAADYPHVDYEHVWLTRDGVAAGVDDVVEAAKAWITAEDPDSDVVASRIDNCPDHYNPGQENHDADSLGDACECFSLQVKITGDIDTSGTLTSADIIQMVNYVFKSGEVPRPCVAAGDVNCDLSVTSSDVIIMVNHIFKSGLPFCDICDLIDVGDWSCL